MGGRVARAAADHVRSGGAGQYHVTIRPHSGSYRHSYSYCAFTTQISTSDTVNHGSTAPKWLPMARFNAQCSVLCGVYWADSTSGSASNVQKSMFMTSRVALAPPLGSPKATKAALSTNTMDHVLTLTRFNLTLDQGHLACDP